MDSKQLPIGITAAIGGLVLFIFSTLALAETPLPEPAQESEAGSRLMPVFGVGFSWPMLMSISFGAGYVLGPPESERIFAKRPTLRTETELGIGGGYVAAGLALPFDDGSFAANLKLAEFRTWLVDLGPQPWRNYRGGIIELVTFGHVPGKAGIGWFRAVDRSHAHRDEFWHVFLGVGW